MALTITVPKAVANDICDARLMGDNPGVWSRIGAAWKIGGRIRLDVTAAELNELADDADYQGWGMDFAVSATPAYRRFYHSLRAKGANRPDLPCCPCEKVT